MQLHMNKYKMHCIFRAVARIKPWDRGDAHGKLCAIIGLCGSRGQSTRHRFDFRPCSCLPILKACYPLCLQSEHPN